MNVMDMYTLCWITVILYLVTYPFLPETVQRITWAKCLGPFGVIFLMVVAFIQRRRDSVKRKRNVWYWYTSYWYIFSAAVYFIVFMLLTAYSWNHWKQLYRSWNQMADLAVLENPWDPYRFVWCCLCCSLGFGIANIIRHKRDEYGDEFSNLITFVAVPVILVVIAAIVWSVLGTIPYLSKAFPF